MDQNKKDKIKEFFKKEGFYTVLFVCLCVIAVVATIATRSNNNASEDKAPEFTLDISENDKATSNPQENDNKPSNDKNLDDKKEDSKVTTSENDNSDIATSANVTETILYYPVEGNLSRGYKEPYISNAKDEARTTSSIHISVEEGSQVKSAGEGIVEEVAKSSGEKGAYVKIKHTDGRVTVYSNLDPNILVNKGDQVTNSTVIGKVGSSSKLYSNSDYKNDLEFELYRADGTVMDPTVIFQYE